MSPDPGRALKLPAAGAHNAIAMLVDFYGQVLAQQAQEIAALRAQLAQLTSEKAGQPAHVP